MTARTIITIATANGAQSEETGRLVAGRLGYRLISDEILDRAAGLAGVTPEEIERAEHSRSLATRMLAALSNMAPMEGGWVPDEAYADRTPAYRAMIQQAILQVAAEGKAVVVAHGAGMLLAGHAEALRVFVTASPDVRAGRIAEERGCDLAEARKVVERTDRERAAYLRRFYEIKREQPFQYDLVVSTDVLTPAQAAAAIVAAAGV